MMHPWGKLDSCGSHHLAHHCADVAACFEVMVSLPVIRARVEKAAGRALTEIDIARLSLIVFLHDSGKLHPGFQAKCGWPDDILPRSKWRGHVREGAAIFTRNYTPFEGRIAEYLHVMDIVDWMGDDEVNLLAASFAHHGRPFDGVGVSDGLGWNGGDKAGYDPLAAAQQLGGAARRWFAQAFAAGGDCLPSTAPFQHLFCGLVSLADWLGSTQAVFRFVAEFDPGYMDEARRRARNAVGLIGLDVSRWRAAVQGRATFEMVSAGHKARGAQACIGDWPLDDLLIILEAETGSGKTEAALWRFAQLFEAGLVDSLYFALPTRAAAKQIHGRVNETLKRLFGADAPEAVMAVPGYLRAGDAGGVALPDYRVLWEDDPDEAKQLARWAAESSKRYLAAMVSVGTVDQAMLAGLEVKHAHLRSATLSRSFLVIDELHASDRYMGKIQNSLLKTHLARGGYAMLMSATLGSQARAVWLGARQAPSFEEAIAAPFPAVWGRDGVCREVDPDAGRQKRVAMELVTRWTPQEAASRAIAAAKAGAKVLVIRNTVKTAVETFAAVQDAGGSKWLWQVNGGPAMHHSRFAAEDRELLDREVEKALTRNEEARPEEALIVIGSQTLEQSLDIDADLLITDLCPVDVLLQRIGRLHRHRLSRPAEFVTPLCVVLSPEGGLDRLAGPAFENGLGAFGKTCDGVYTNLHSCELTSRLIVSDPVWTIPDMNRWLVESATHDEPIEALNAEKGDSWKSYWNSFLASEMAKGQQALGLLRVNKSFAQMGLFLSDEQAVRTRLGAEGARIEFDRPATGPFGREITGMTMPGHWRIEAPEKPVSVELCEGKLVFQVGDHAFDYDRTGLTRP